MLYNTISFKNKQKLKLLGFLVTANGRKGKITLNICNLIFLLWRKIEDNLTYMRQSNTSNIKESGNFGKH